MALYLVILRFLIDLMYLYDVFELIAECGDSGVWFSGEMCGCVSLAGGNAVVYRSLRKDTLIVTR